MTPQILAWLLICQRIPLKCDLYSNFVNITFQEGKLTCLLCITIEILSTILLHLNGNFDMTTWYIIMCLIQYDTLIVKPFNAPTLYVKYCPEQVTTKNSVKMYCVLYRYMTYS